MPLCMPRPISLPYFTSSLIWQTWAPLCIPHQIDLPYFTLSLLWQTFAPLLLECLTAACKALSLANSKGKGTNWIGNRVFRLGSRKEWDLLGRDLQKPFGGFKTVNSILLTKYCSHRTEISTKDIVTLPHDKEFGH
jgi:hypothetical protein